jgi:NADPH-dependent 2,4-dienoyl-CoA reductase/sulfur reductase-like enzyme
VTDALVVGSGPAGMSAALGLLQRGITVTVVDDQPTPGGRIFASIESRTVKGAEDRGGASLVSRFRAAGGMYLPGAELWGIETSPIRVFLTRDGRARMLEPRYVVLATGAQERPLPFPGWELPGVMTVGSAQILLKTARQVPDRPVWLAGTGPLLLLYARQLVENGGTIAGILDTTAPGRTAAAARHLPGALTYGWKDLARGVGWLAGMRGIRTVRGVASMRALGGTRLQSVHWRTRGGVAGCVETDLLLTHDGVVPAIHGTLAADCEHRWNADQQCFEPVVDVWGETSRSGVYVVGDGATIRGARSAVLSGSLAAIGIAAAAGRIRGDQAEAAAVPLRREMNAGARFRRLVDTLYPPSRLPIPDDAMLCRCEEVTAGRIRQELRDRPHMGTDGVKVETRAGMGPCQGRQCGLGITRLVAEIHRKSEDEVGFLRIRPPLKPLTLRELAALEDEK